MYELAFDPNGDTLVIGYELSEEQGEETGPMVTAHGIEFFDTAVPTPTSISGALPVSPGEPTGMTISADGRTVFTYDMNGKLQVWRMPDRSRLVVDGQERLRSMALNPTGDSAVFDAYNGGIWLVDTVTGSTTVLREPTYTDRLFNPSAGFDADGQTVIVNTGLGEFTVRDDTGHTVHGTVPDDAYVNSLVLTTDAERVFAAVSEGRLLFWDRSLKYRAPQRLHQDTDRSVDALTVTPDQRTLVYATTKGILLWDITGQPTVTAGPFGPDADSLVGLAVSGDSSILAVLDTQGIQLWDITDPAHPIRRNALVQTLPAPDSVALSGNGELLAVGLIDGGLLLWDLTGPEPTRLGAGLPGARRDADYLAFPPDRGILIALSESGTLRSWVTGTAQAEALLCATSRLPITEAQWFQYFGELPYRPPCS